MKLFAMGVGFVALIASAQDKMTDEEINGLFDNREPGTLISPAPETNGGTHGEEDGKSHEEIDPELQAGLDWMLDFYNTFCNGSTEAMVDSSAPSPEQI